MPALSRWEEGESLRVARRNRPGVARKKEELNEKRFLEVAGLVFGTSDAVTHAVCAEEEELGIGEHPDLCIGAFPTRSDWMSRTLGSGRADCTALNRRLRSSARRPHRLVQSNCTCLGSEWNYCACRVRRVL